MCAVSKYIILYGTYNCCSVNIVFYPSIIIIYTAISHDSGSYHICAYHILNHKPSIG